MREDCRHFQSRTYDTGETARMCVLNLAPEAPWHCPAECASYQRDIIDSSFVTGSLARPAVEDEPEDDPSDIAALLDDADAIVTAAGPGVVAEIEAERHAQPWWKRRRRRPGGDGNLHLGDG